MGILSFFKKGKPDISVQDFYRALYGYRVTNGVGIPIPDKPESYIRDGYAGNADVYSIISKINNMSRQGRIKLVQKNNKGEEEEVTGHPLNEFLYFVNSSMSFEMFWAATHIYKLTVGNSYWYKPMITVGPDIGKTLELHIMPAQFTEVIPGDWLNPVKGYKMNFDNEVTFTPNQVYHQKFFDPRFNDTFFLYGLSPIKAAAQVVAKLNEAEATEQKSFENSSPPYILFRKQDGRTMYEGLTKEQQFDLKKQLRENSQQLKRGEPVVSRIELDMLKLGVSPVDLGILESSIAGMRRLCNIYNIPSVLMNDNENSSYNNVSSARRAAWTDCIIPLNKSFATDLTYFLTNGINEYEPFYFVYDYSEVEEMQEAIAGRVTWMRQAGWSKNEIRQATGRPRVEVPIMDEPIFNQGEIPLSDMTFNIDEEKDFVDYDKKRT